jgi:hypothetical protein
MDLDNVDVKYFPGSILDEISLESAIKDLPATFSLDGKGGLNVSDTYGAINVQTFDCSFSKLEFDKQKVNVVLASLEYSKVIYNTIQYHFFG